MKKFIIIIGALVAAFILLILFSLPSAIEARFEKIKAENALLKESKLSVSFLSTFPNLLFEISGIRSPDNNLTIQKASFSASIFKLISSKKLSLTIFVDKLSLNASSLSTNFLNRQEEGVSEKNAPLKSEKRAFYIGKVELRDSEISYNGKKFSGVLGTIKANFEKTNGNIRFYDIILHGVTSSQPIQLVGRFHIDSTAYFLGVDEVLFTYRDELNLRLNTAISYADNISLQAPFVAQLTADNASLSSFSVVLKPFLPNLTYFDNITSGSLSMNINLLYDNGLKEVGGTFDIKDIQSESKYLKIDNGSATFDGKNLLFDNISFSLYSAKGLANGKISGVDEALLYGKELQGKMNITGEMLDFDKFMQTSIDENEANLKESKRESTHSVKIIYFDHFEKSNIDLTANFKKVNYLGGKLNDVEFRGFICNGAIHLDDFSSKRVSLDIGVR